MSNRLFTNFILKSVLYLRVRTLPLVYVCYAAFQGVKRQSMMSIMSLVCMHEKT